MFAVLYRWTIREGTESELRDAWRSMTESIRARHETGGSRLHRSDDGTFVAYAVWPSRAHWEQAGKLPSSNPEAAARMRACILETITTTPLEILDDLLVGPP